jgi:hypothetical protein
MSNTLAIAVVTALLKDILENELTKHPMAISIGDLLVTALPPDRISVGSDERPQLNVFLYQISQNRNADWIEKNSLGQDAANSTGYIKTQANESFNQSSNEETPLALDLHYLITAYGAKDFQSELLLGYAMQVLQGIPVIKQDRICTALKHAAAMTSFGVLAQVLATTSIDNLAKQVGQIKLSPEFFSMEETSKLWSSLQTHYRPSAAYQASMVLLGNGHPPSESNASSIPCSQPAIDRVHLELDAPGNGHWLILQGQGLQGTMTRIRITGRSSLLNPQTVQDTQVSLILPPDLPAGIQGVQVVHLEPNSDRTVVQEIQSNLAAFVIQPIIRVHVSSNQSDESDLCHVEISLAVQPFVNPNQQAILLLHDVFGDRPSYRFPFPQRDAPLGTLSMSVLVKVGSYWAQLQVDGAQSPSPTATYPVQVTLP